MFCVELKFVADCLLRWFNRKFKSQHLETTLGRKVAYDPNNPINWDKDKCYICNFPVKINAKGPNILSAEMSYTDFHIRFEHKFFRNLYTKEELVTSTHLSTLENY